eukprot:gene2322-8420_t
MAHHSEGLTKAEVSDVEHLLKTNTVLFKFATPGTISAVAQGVTKKTFAKNDVLIEQGAPQNEMFIMRDGIAERTRVEGSGAEKVIRQFGSKETKATTGGLHFLKGDKAEVRSSSKPKQRTPLGMQKQTSAQSPVVATSVAATVESFYRSALNAYINAHLTGSPVSKLFPDMHVQIPMRVVYINGTKGTRAWLNNNIDPRDYSVSTAILLAPGLSMTPMSSVLEAANAGHKNPEPLKTRWMRGLAARAVREIIFAIGLNQAADYCEERVPVQVENGLLRNTAGSLTAERLPKHWSQQQKQTVARVLGVVAPKAVMTRTVQIIGTFVLLNGIIYSLRDISPF